VEQQAAALREAKGGTANEVAWQRAPRPTDSAREAAIGEPPGLPSIPTKAKVGSNSYSIEATAQVAQSLSPLGGPAPGKQYFEDLPPELQRVLGAQLQKGGDVSAVIETAGAFQVHLAKDRTAESLSVVVFIVRKRSYEEWLAEQPDP
jgi:hypothetical protein